MAEKRFVLSCCNLISLVIYSAKLQKGLPGNFLKNFRPLTHVTNILGYLSQELGLSLSQSVRFIITTTRKAVEAHHNTPQDDYLRWCELAHPFKCFQAGGQWEAITRGLGLAMRLKLSPLY